MADLEARIKHYQNTYETVREQEGAYIKLFNLSAKAHACNVYGRMTKSVLPYLLAIRMHAWWPSNRRLLCDAPRRIMRPDGCAPMNDAP